MRKRTFKMCGLSECRMYGKVFSDAYRPSNCKTCGCLLVNATENRLKDLGYYLEGKDNWIRD